MTNMTIEEVNGKKKGKLTDVMFCYMKVQQPVPKYKSETEKEYSVDIVVDKPTAKAFKKAFQKNSYKEVDTADFQGIYKVPAPFPDADEQFVVKLKANAQIKKSVNDLREGDMIPYEWSSRPKVFVPTDGGVKDVTMEVLVANGSFGDVAFNITTNDYGTFPQLTGILVKDLIEYQSTQGSSSDFGEVVGGYNPGQQTQSTTPQEPAHMQEQVPDSAAPAQQPAPVDDWDEDVPF